MQFDQDTIKDLGVYAVQQFVSHGTPLNDSIAEKARGLRLTEEQVKRVVEATNVIAFLKLRSEAQDKTFEFDVADFDGVMEKIMTPSVNTSVVASRPVMEKAASVAAFDIPLEVPQENLHQYLGKQLYQIRAELEKVAYDYHYASFDLESKVNTLVKQANWQERLQAVTEPQQFESLCTVLCAGSGLEKSASLKDLVFVGKELEIAKGLVEHIKQASALSVRKAELEGMEKKALAALASLVGKSVSGLASASGKLAGGAARGAGTLLTGVPRAGFKAGKATVNTLQKHKIGGVAMGAAAATAAAAVSYSPKPNAQTGQSRDVWQSLYD